MIRLVANNKFNLEVLSNLDGHVVYQRQFDYVIDSWVLTEDKLIY